MRAGRRMVRANGQRDGVGKTSQLSGAFEHTGAILDPTRVSPYRPAAGDMPQSMRPDTREHLTACTKPSEGQMRPMALASLGGVYLAHGQPRLSNRCAAPPLRCGPAGDCRGRPCGKPLRASRKASPHSTGASARDFGAPLVADNRNSKDVQNEATRQLPGGIRTR